MSKIIKASQNSRVERFDFSEIRMVLSDVDSTPPQYEDSTDEKAQEVLGDTPNSSLDDLENIIRNRLLEAERQAQETEKAAYENGYAQGQKDGFEYGKKSALIIQEQLQNLLMQLGTLPSRAFENYREWFIGASLSMARCIVQNDLKTNPESLCRLMTSLINEAEEHHSLALYLNPKDLELLKKQTSFESWLEQLSPSFSLKTDAGLTPGGCRLESEIQLLDATLETRFALLEEMLKAQMADTEAQDIEVG